MTREEALEVLNLTSSASPEDIEAAYQRLVRRYPPEFQPEKFRGIDEAYRFLTSFAYQVERLMNPQKEQVVLKRELLDFTLEPPTTLEDARREVKKHYLFAYLWRSSDLT
jgi:hypothetical protein